MRPTMARTVGWTCLVSLISLVLASVAAAGEHRRLVVFGDSLSDPGNAFVLLRDVDRAPFELIPSAPYARGGHHFSNGETWVEQLARDLNLAPSAGPAHRVPGVFSNYAVGGARAREVGFVHLSTQVGLFLGDFGGVAPADALYVVFIGGDDLRDALAALSIDPSGATSTQILLAALGAIQGNIAALVGEGAQTFLVLNEPNVAVAPAVRLLGAGAQTAAQALTVAFNSGLDQLLDALEASFGVTIFRVNAFALTNEIVAEPARFGLSEVEETCITVGTKVSPFCEHPDEFLFWDGIHPTRAGHGILADEALAVLAQP